MKNPHASFGILEINYKSSPCLIWISPKKTEKNPCLITKTEYLPYYVVKLMMKCLPASSLVLPSRAQIKFFSFACLIITSWNEQVSVSFLENFQSGLQILFYTGDYVCHMIGHEVLFNKPARVTLVTSASGCTRHSYVTSLNSRLCCVGRAFS